MLGFVDGGLQDALCTGYGQQRYLGTQLFLRAIDLLIDFAASACNDALAFGPRVEKPNTLNSYHYFYKFVVTWILIQVPTEILLTSLSLPSQNQYSDFGSGADLTSLRLPVVPLLLASAVQITGQSYCLHSQLG